MNFINKMVETKVIEIKTGGSSQLDVAIVNGMHVCSPRDPMAEAQKWFARNEALFKKYNKVCVLGLGMGYHIEVLCERYSESQIVVLEFHQALIDRFNEKNKFQNLQLISEEEVWLDHRKTGFALDEMVVVSFLPACLNVHGFYEDCRDQLLARKDEAFWTHCIKEKLFVKKQKSSQAREFLSEMSRDHQLGVNDIKQMIEECPEGSVADSLWLALGELVK